MSRRRIWIGRVLLTLLVLCCLTAAAGAEEKLSLHDGLKYQRGKTTISWDINDDTSSFYVVTYQVVDNGTAQQGVAEAGRTSGNSVETTGIIPGKSYEITVKDLPGNVLSRKTYHMDEAETFADGKLKNTSVKITIKGSSVKPGGNNKPKQYSSLKAADVEAAYASGEVFYGIRYQMAMPRLKEDRHFFVTLALESPDGFLYVDKAKEITFDMVNRGTQTLWWPVAGVDFFHNLYRLNGRIPAGRYTAYLFWEGMWVNTSTFTLK